MYTIVVIRILFHFHFIILDSFQSQDVGCFSKSSSLPLVLSHPYASAIREKLYAGRLKEQKDIEDVKSKETKELTAEEKQEVIIFA